MIFTYDDEIAELIRMLLRHGGKDKYNVDHIGYNARLDTIQAAVLLSKIKYIDEFNDRRRHIAEIYTRELSGIDGLILPFSNTQPADGNVYHQYTVRTSSRDKLQKHLSERGISTMVYYPFPLHKMRVFDKRAKVSGQLADAEKATLEVISLPIEPLQEIEDTKYVVESIKQFYGAN